MTIEPGTPEAEDFERELLLLGRNHAPDRFLVAVIDGEISTELMRQLILDVWSGAEVPLRAIGDGDGAWWWRKLFSIAGFVADTEELPEMPLTVFRGAPLDKPQGFSWSWSRETAKLFAVRYQGAFGESLGRRYGIFSVTLDREHLLGVITEGRGECEVIVDPEILTGELQPKLEEAIRLEDAGPRQSLNFY
jgi:hypothetical protein